MTKALDEMRRLFADGSLAGLSDGQLLKRFAARGDVDAFAAIVARHGAVGPGRLPVVARLPRRHPCRGRLPGQFLVLVLVRVRLAGSFLVHDLLTRRMYRVARRVVRQARVEASRRRARERAAAGRESGPHSTPPATNSAGWSARSWTTSPSGIGCRSCSATSTA